MFWCTHTVKQRKTEFNSVQYLQGGTAWSGNISTFWWLMLANVTVTLLTKIPLRLCKMLAIC